MLEEISGQSLQDQDWKSTKCSKKCQAQACRFRTGKVPNARRNVRPKLVGLQLENYQILEELSGQSFGFSHHQIFELLQPLSKQKSVSEQPTGLIPSTLMLGSISYHCYPHRQIGLNLLAKISNSQVPVRSALICPVQRRFGKFHHFQFFNTPYIGKTVRLTTLDKSPSQNGY